MKEVAIKVKTVGTPVAESLRYRLISDEMVNLTRTKAFEILEYDTFTAERPVREYWVQMLYNEWLAGRFVWHMAMVAHGVVMERGPDNTRIPHIYRLNGQHTCWMRVSIPKDKEPKSPCKVRQLIYECEDMDGLREIYAVIDRNAPRTNAHISKVLLADATARDGLPLSYLNNMIAGMKLWLWESKWERTFKGNPQEMSALIQGRYKDIFHIVSIFFQTKYNEWGHIRKAGIVAALLATFDKHGGEAAAFWDQVCSGLNFTSKTDPRYQLRRYCEDHQIGQGNQPVSAEDLYRVALNMFNKWRTGEEVASVHTTDSRPKVK